MELVFTIIVATCTYWAGRGTGRQEGYNSCFLRYNKLPDGNNLYYIKSKYM